MDKSYFVGCKSLTHIDGKLGVSEFVGGVLDSDESSSKSLGNVGADIQHINNNLSDLLVLALFLQDVVQTGIGVLLLGGGVEGGGGSSVFSVKLGSSTGVGDSRGKGGSRSNQEGKAQELHVDVVAIKIVMETREREGARFSFAGVGDTLTNPSHLVGFRRNHCCRARTSIIGRKNRRSQKHECVALRQHALSKFHDANVIPLLRDAQKPERELDVLIRLHRLDL